MDNEPLAKFSISLLNSILVNFSVLHDDINVLLCIHQQANIPGWVAIDDDDVRKCAFFFYSLFSVDAADDRGPD